MTVVHPSSAQTTTSTDISAQEAHSPTGDMDLDDDPTPDAIPPPHQTPSFAAVVAGTSSNHPAPRFNHENHAELNTQVGCAHCSWKTLPPNLHFKKYAETSRGLAFPSPNVGDKRPFNVMDNLAGSSAPSKRANIPMQAALNTPSVTAPASTPAALPTNYLPHSPLTNSPHDREEMNVDLAPLGIQLQAVTAPAETQIQPLNAPINTHNQPLTALPAIPIQSPIPITPFLAQGTSATPAAHAQPTHAQIANVPIALPPYIPPNAANVLAQPAAGFPIVYGLEQGLLSFVQNSSIDLWKKRRGASALVYIGGDGMAPNITRRVQAIEAFFQTVFPGFPPPQVGPPQYFKKNDRKLPFKPVIPYFVSGHRDLINTLKSCTCWPTPSVTLFVTTMTPETTDFTIAIHGFPLDRSNASDLIVREAVRDTLNNDTNICTFITNFNDNLPDMQPDQLIAFVSASVRIQSTSVVEGNNPKTIFNLYITPPTTVPERFMAWIQELKKMSFSCFRGTGSWRCSFYCDTCKGRDHPTVACPFAAIPGWPANPAFVNDSVPKPPPAAVSGGARGGYNNYRGRGGGSSLRSRRGRAL